MIKHIFFFTFLVVSTLGFLYLLKPFFEPILWAITLAIIFAPVYKYFLNKLNGRQSLSSLVTLLVIIFTVVVPTIVLLIAVVNESAKIFNSISSGKYDFEKPIAWIQQSIPILDSFFQKLVLILK